MIALRAPSLGALGALDASVSLFTSRSSHSMASPSSSLDVDEDTRANRPQLAQAQPEDIQEAPELQQMSSFFPAPPAAFERFTAANLDLAAELQRLIKSGAGSAEADRMARQRRLLGERAPDFDLLELVEPPDASWIEEEGGWKSFGESWPLEEKLPTLHSLSERPGSMRIIAKAPSDDAPVVLPAHRLAPGRTAVAHASATGRDDE